MLSYGVLRRKSRVVVRNLKKRPGRLVQSSGEHMLRVGVWRDVSGHHEEHGRAWLSIHFTISTTTPNRGLRSGRTCSKSYGDNGIALKHAHRPRPRADLNPQTAYPYPASTVGASLSNRDATQVVGVVAQTQSQSQYYIPQSSSCPIAASCIAAAVGTLARF